jgi:hypothetical protein
MGQRREFALKALGTLNFRALCEEYEISTKTGYKWRERFLRQGPLTIRDEFSRYVPLSESLGGTGYPKQSDPITGRPLPACRHCMV